LFISTAASIAKKLELPKDPPSISIGNEGQSVWVNEVKFFLLSNLQVYSAAYLCQKAFPPANAAARAIYASQEMLALCLDKLYCAHDASLLGDDIGNASRRLSGQPVALLTTKMWPRMLLPCPVVLQTTL
jgi:hypothetical protein